MFGIQCTTFRLMTILPLFRRSLIILLKRLLPTPIHKDVAPRKCGGLTMIFIMNMDADGDDQRMFSAHKTHTQTYT